MARRELTNGLLHHPWDYVRQCFAVCGQARVNVDLDEPHLKIYIKLSTNINFDLTESRPKIYFVSYH